MANKLTRNVTLANVLIFKGSIAVASDFPTLTAVKTGWFYIVSTDVTDNDPTKTNTGTSFLTGDEIVWTGSTWDVVGSLVNGLYLKLDQTTPQTVINGRPIFYAGVHVNGLTANLSINSGVYTIEGIDVTTNILGTYVKSTDTLFVNPSGATISYNGYYWYLGLGAGQWQGGDTLPTGVYVPIDPGQTGNPDVSYARVAPYTTDSNTLNTNLNADLLDGHHSSDFLSISKSFVHYMPVLTSKKPIESVDSAVTITKLKINVLDGTSITGRLVEYDTDGVTLIQVISADITATAGTQSVTTSFTHPVVASGKFIGWEVTAVVGAVSNVSVTYSYTK